MTVVLYRMLTNNQTFTDKTKNPGGLGGAPGFGGIGMPNGVSQRACHV